MEDVSALKTDTEVQITCKVKGVTESPDIVWTSSPGSADVTGDATSYRQTDAAIIAFQKSSVLTILNPLAATSQYYCSVTSAQWSKTNDEHQATVYIYGMIKDI